MDILWFPFDYQLCELRLGSWSHSKNEINYLIPNVTRFLYYYTESNEWYMEEYKINYIINSTCKVSMGQINFSFLLKRKSRFIIHDSIVPTFLLSILILVCCFISYENQIEIIITVFMSYIVLAFKFHSTIPHQAQKLPFLSVYFTACMFNSVLAMLLFIRINKLKYLNRIPKSIASFAIAYLTWLPTCKRDKLIILKKSFKFIYRQKETHKHAKCLFYCYWFKNLRWKRSNRVNPLIDNDPRIILNEKEFIKEIVEVLNKFIFKILFLLFILKNLIMLIIIPNMIQKPFY